MTVSMITLPFTLIWQREWACSGRCGGGRQLTLMVRQKRAISSRIPAPSVKKLILSPIMTVMHKN